MTKKLLLAFTILIVSGALTLAQDETSPADTSVETAPLSFADSVLQLSLRLFTSNQRIEAEEKDNLILQDLSGYLKVFRSLDITNTGSLSQAKNFSMGGIPSANPGIYYEDFFINPASSTIPFQSRAELDYLPVENIASIRLVENPLLNLIFADSRIGGIYLEGKDYLGGEPYSRLTFEQGMRGYRRTQVDFGRGFRKKLRFYGTFGIRKSEGELAHTNQDLDNYSFKLSYDADQKTRLVGSGQFYSGKRDLTPFPGWEQYGLRRKENFQKLNLTFYRRLLADNLLKAAFDFTRFKQETKPLNWQTIDKIYGLRLEFYPPSLGRNSTKISWNSYEYKFQDESSHSLHQDNFSLTNLLQLSPHLWWLAWGNFEGVDSTGDFVIDRKFSFLTGLAFQPASEWRLYTSGGRLNTHPGLKETYSPKRTFPVNDTLPIYAENGNLRLRGGYHWHLQFGVDLEKERLKLGSYFYLANSKRAVTISSVDTLTYGYWSPANRDLRVYGGNVYFGWQLSSAFRFYVNWNLKSWEEGEQPPFLPKSSLFSYFEIDQEYLKNQLGWRVRIEGEYLGKRRNRHQDPLDDVVVLNSKFTLRILAVNFYFVFENLTNQTYQSGSELRMPKRNNWWGLYWEFFD